MQESRHQLRTHENCSAGAVLRKPRHLRLILGVIVVAAATAVPMAGLLPRSQAVVNGSPVDGTPSWAAVFVAPNGGIACSGALIAANAVVTANHDCASPGTRVVVGGAAAQVGGGVVVGVARITSHPQQDLAIHFLDRSVGLTPISIGSGDPSSDPMSFIPFTVYGSGRVNDLNETPPLYDGRLRTAVGLVAQCDSRFGVAAPQFCLKPQSIQAPCRGDSGAPLVAAGHLMAVFRAVLWVGQERCAGSDWNAVSVTNREVRQWVDDTLAANPPS